MTQQIRLRTHFHLRRRYVCLFVCFTYYHLSFYFLVFLHAYFEIFLLVCLYFSLCFGVVIFVVRVVGSLDFMNQLHLQNQLILNAD